MAQMTLSITKLIVMALTIPKVILTTLSIILEKGVLSITQYNINAVLNVILV
jgi:hypothetical protein